MSDVQTVREDFVQLWGRLGRFWGISPAAARVYAWLLSTDERPDAETLMAELGMSRGAVSMACRELADWGLILEQKAAGERRITYLPETDLEKALRTIVRNRKRREWDPILTHLREWIPELARSRSREAALFRERLESIEALVGLADDMANSFLQGGTVSNLGLKLLLATAGKRARKKKKKKRRDERR